MKSLKLSDVRAEVNVIHKNKPLLPYTFFYLSLDLLLNCKNSFFEEKSSTVKDSANGVLKLPEIFGGQFFVCMGDLIIFKKKIWKGV